MGLRLGLGRGLGLGLGGDQSGVCWEFVRFVARAGGWSVWGVYIYIVLLSRCLR